MTKFEITLADGIVVRIAAPIRPDLKIAVRDAERPCERLSLSRSPEIRSLRCEETEDAHTELITQQKRGFHDALQREEHSV